MRGVWAIIVMGVALWERYVNGATGAYYALMITSNIWAASIGLAKERR